MKAINKSIRLSIFLVSLLIISILMSSCVPDIGGTEIEDLAIVTSIGIDYEDEKVKVTFEVVNPEAVGVAGESGQSGSGSQAFVYPQGVGRTIKEAITNVNLHFDKKIFLSHSNMLILGEEFAKRGIIDLMDFFLRDNEPREDMYMVVAKDRKAYDVFGVRAGLGRASGNYLYDILNNFTDNAKSINISFAEMFRYYYDVSNDPVIGVVQIEEEVELDEMRKEEQSTKKLLDVTGGAVFRRDYLLGYFTGDEMKGFNFIVGDIKGGTLVFRTPVQSTDEQNIIIGTDGKFTSVDILKSTTKQDISIDNGKVHLTLNVKLKVELNETNQALDIADPKVIKRIEMACSDKVKQLISVTLDKGQKEFEQDNFSIGIAVHRQYPEIWKEIGSQWQDIFPEMSYDVNVETTLVKRGLINTPANVRRRR